MINIAEVRFFLNDFEKKHPRAGVENLGELLQHIHLEDGLWSSYWSQDGIFRKYAESPCVYFFFSEEGSLLYVGHTQVLGKRFGSHFTGDGIGTKQVHEVAFLPIPRAIWFEILAIEAYCIEKLTPPLNKSIPKATSASLTPSATNNSWSNEAIDMTREVISNLSFVPYNDYVHLKNINSTFGQISAMDIIAGKLLLIDKKNKAEIFYQNIEAMLADGWVVD